MKPGRIPRGQPGGHIGDRLTYAYCPECGLEWVYNASGLPNCMNVCIHPDVVAVNFVAESHGVLDD